MLAWFPLPLPVVVVVSREPVRMEGQARLALVRVLHRWVRSGIGGRGGGVGREAFFLPSVRGAAGGMVGAVFVPIGVVGAIWIMVWCNSGGLLGRLLLLLLRLEAPLLLLLGGGCLQGGGALVGQRREGKSLTRQLHKTRQLHTNGSRGIRREILGSVSV